MLSKNIDSKYIDPELDLQKIGYINYYTIINKKYFFRIRSRSIEKRNKIRY